MSKVAIDVALAKGLNPASARPFPERLKRANESTELLSVATAEFTPA